MHPQPAARPPRRVPALLWDLDGTILDSIDLIVEGADYAFAGREGPRPTRAEWQALIGTSLDSMLARWAIDVDDFTALRARYRQFQGQNHDRLVRLYPDVADLLRYMHARGHPMAIVSSKMEAGILRSMDHFGLTQLFERIVGTESTARHKPDPEPVRFALDALGVAPAHALYIGDSPHDSAAANAAGVSMVGVTWGAYTDDEIAAAGPSRRVSSAAEIAALVEAFGG